MRVRLLAALAFGLALSACASIQPARMAMPGSVAASMDVAEIAGMGGGTRGSYTAALHSGSFTRSESRLAFFDVVENRSGRSSFTLAGPEIDGQIEAQCTMRERNINLGDISFTPRRMAYGCDFTSNGRAFPARFEIQEAREGIGGALMKRERRGEIALDREILQVRSVHEVEGSPIQMAAPIGYVFEREGRVVGAVELNGTPRMFLARDADVAVRRAVIAGSMALAVFWDPANSSLGE